MERPDASTVAFYERNVPDDPRAVRSRMFGFPCAFVNGHMFFGTFAQSVVVRLGVERTAALAGSRGRVFEPMDGRAWKEYLQVDTGALPDADLLALSREALETTARLPPKEKAARSPKGTKGKGKTGG